ncbi:MAG: GyrI-like domain-containing protein [Chitinophagaceae bacterium]|nr:GyrI-like domain-containing protein [Chitinophagaceae bacterium]
MNSSVTGCLLSICLLLACNGKEKQRSQPGDSNALVKPKSKPGKPVPPVKKPPIINITDTVSVKRIVLCMRDSAANDERLAGKLARIYGSKLAEVFKKEKLKVTGSPMAWFKNKKTPYFFEAGIPVNKRPGKLPKGVFIKETRADSIVLAHFYGPYDLIPQGYDAVKEWMKETKHVLRGVMYEIYVTDPLDKKGKPVDPYKIQTDIVFPLR